MAEGMAAADGKGGGNGGEDGVMQGVGCAPGVTPALGAAACPAAGTGAGGPGIRESTEGGGVDEEAADDSVAWLETGRLLFAGPCEFLRGVADLVQLPEAGHAEIAFVGRSNVGKSSLVNALTGRRTLARTSNTPGRTQQLNFFDLGGRVMLVDLPGYGYGAEAKEKVAAWTALVRAYLKGRVPLLRVCLLIDARHGPMRNDEEIMTLLDRAAVSYQLVLTKADKVKPHQAAARLAEATRVAARHAAAHPVTIVTSAETGAGVPELRATLAALIGPRAP